MKKLIITLLFISLSAFSQEIFLKDVSKSYNLGITHNQGLSYSHSLSDTAAASNTSCTGNVCDFNFNTKGDYNLHVEVTDELGLTNSKDVAVKVGDYICETVTYYRQTQNNSYTLTEGPIYDNSPQYYYRPNGSPTQIFWNGNQLYWSASPIGNSMTIDGWTYHKDALQSGDYYKIRRTKPMPASCGTPSSSTRTICYPSNTGSFLNSGNTSLGVNSGHSSCSNDYVNSSGNRRVYISSSTSGWSSANSTLSTSIFPSGALIRSGSVSIGEDLGSH